MKKIIYVLLLLINSFCVYSQRDSIYLKDGRSFRGKILQEDSINVFFSITTKFSKNEYTTTSVLKDDIKSIKYHPVNPFPWNFGIGFGPSYGGVLGCHALLGKNNHGLLLGLGVSPRGFISPSIGLQAASKWFFINSGVGPCGIFRRNDDPFKLVYAIYANVGGMINLDKKEKIYLELGVGSGIKLTQVDRHDYEPFEYYKYTGSLGIGFRLGRK